MYYKRLYYTIQSCRQYCITSVNPVINPVRKKTKRKSQQVSTELRDCFHKHISGDGSCGQFIVTHQVCSRKKKKQDLTLGRGAYRLALPQLLLGTIKVKVNIKTLYKLCDWVLICVRLLWRKKKTFHALHTSITLGYQSSSICQKLPVELL